MTLLFSRKGDGDLVPIIITSLILIIVALSVLYFTNRSIPTSFKEVQDITRDVGEQFNVYVLGKRPIELQAQDDTFIKEVYTPFLQTFQACAQASSSSCWCALSVPWFPEDYFITFFSKKRAGYFSYPGTVEDGKAYILPNLEDIVPFTPYGTVPPSLQEKGLFCFLGIGDRRTTTGDSAAEWRDSLVISRDGNSLRFTSSGQGRDPFFTYPLKSAIYLFKTRKGEVCFAPRHFKPTTSPPCMPQP